MKRLLSVLLSVIIVCGCFNALAVTNVSATQDRTSYFSKNYTLTGNPVDDIVAVAQAQANRNKAQMGYTEAWCANFVGDCASLAGLGNVIPRAGYCGTLYNNIIDAGGKEVGSPQKGDIIFYICEAGSVNCPGSGYPWVHVGIMTGPSSSIEGNSGGKVAVKSKVTYTDMNGHTYGHSGTNSVTVKYLRPNYPEQEPETKYWYEDLELVDLGDNFSARIRNVALDVLVTNFNGNVVIGKHYDYKIARQIWNFDRNSDGSYKIKSCLNDYCMELHNFDDFDGGNITCIPNNGSTAQDWFIYLNSDGSYSMRPKCSDERVIDVANGDPTDGNNLQLWSYNKSYSQKFSIEKCGEVVNLGDIFAASIEHTDYWKPIYQDDTDNVVLTTSSKEKMSGILWYFERDEENGWYTITSYKNAKWLEVEDNSTEQGANVQCGDYVGAHGQHWFILKSIDSEGTEYHYIKSACSSNNLDLDYNLEDDGTNIKMWQLNGSDAQKYSIYKIEEETSYSISATDNTIGIGESIDIVIDDTTFVTSYKFHIVSPDGTKSVINNNCNYIYRFTPSQTGRYVIYGEVESPVSKAMGSETDRCVEIFVSDHNYTSNVTKSATCTASGIKTYTCTSCGDTYTESIPAKGHTEVVDKAVAPKCTKTGLTEGKHCSECNIVLIKQNEVEALCHSAESNWTTVSTSDAGKITQVKYCSRCGVVVETREIIDGSVTSDPTEPATESTTIATNPTETTVTDPIETTSSEPTESKPVETTVAEPTESEVASTTTTVATDNATEFTEPSTGGETEPTETSIPDETESTEPSTPDEIKPTEPTEDRGILGDVNGDGKVNIKDATQIQKFAAKLIELTNEEKLRADVNSDNKNNVKDATVIQKYIAKLETGFLVGEPIVLKKDN